MIALSARMWRSHAAAYAAVLVMVAASTALSAGLLTLLAAPLGEDPARDTVEQQAAQDMVGLTSAVMGWSVAVSVFATVYVVASTVAFCLDARTQELALLRLVGATPRQVKRLLRLEMLLCAALGSIPGAVLGLPVALAVHSAMSAVGFADPSAVPVWSTGASVGSGAITVAATMVGALGPSRRAGGVAPLRALGLPGTAKSAMSASRWILALTGMGASAALLSLSRGEADAQLTATIGASLLLVAGLAALAPVAVPLVAGGIGGLARLTWPGPGTLAQADITHHARRTATLATPLILVIGAYATLGTITATANAERRHESDVAAVVVTGSGLDATELLALCDARSDTSDCAPVADTTAVMDGGSGPTTALVRVLDPAASSALQLQVSQGALSDLTGTAVGTSPYLVALPELVLTTPDGAAHPVRPAVAIDRTGLDRAYSDVYLSFTQAQELGLDLTPDLWVLPSLSVTAEQLAASLAAEIGRGEVRTLQQVEREQAAEQTTENRNAMLTLVGAAEILALVSVAVTCLSSARERVDALALLHRSGASRAQILSSTAIEIGLVVTVAAVAVVWIPLFAAAKLHRLLPGASVLVPWPELGGLFAIAALLALATSLAGTAYQFHKVVFAGDAANSSPCSTRRTPS